MKRILSVLLALVMVLGMIPMVASAEETKVVFDLGANGTASHYDGSEKSSYSATVDGYTLSITGGKKMYTGARDAKGNSCIKLGTSSVVGGFSFTVPKEVDSVEIAVAKYKAKTSKVSINGTTTTLTKSSDNGQYDVITVDTANTKTVSVATVSGGVRAMVNSITFIVTSGSEGEETCAHTNTIEVAEVAATCTTDGTTAGVQCVECEAFIDGHVTVPALGHSYSEWVVVSAATCTEAGQQAKTCATCGDVQNEVIAATGHSYADGVCSACDAKAPDAVAALITSADQFTSGDYILMVSSGYAMGAYKDSWVTAVKPVMSDSEIVDAVGAIWTLTVDGSTVKIKDANGVTIKPKSGNNNGILTGDYNWQWAVNADGTFTFKGTGSDTTTLASNTDATNGHNQFRAYKNTTVADTKTYLAKFSVYKVGAGDVVDPDCEHTNTTEVAEVPATCGKPGTTAGEKCDNCGEIVSGCEEIPATGNHNFVNYVCDVCGVVNLPAAGSTLTIPVASAIGAAQGHDTYTADKYYVTGVVESITNETYGNMYIQDEDGNKILIYGVYNADGTTRYDAMAPKPVVGDTVTFYGVLGSYSGTAQMKNGWLTEHIPVKICEHPNQTTTTVDATCEEAGSATVTCDDCGITISTETIPALPHNYIDGVCENCGKNENEIEATITFDDAAKRTEYTTEIQVWAENGVTVTNNKASATSNVGDYVKPARFYKGSTVTIAYPGITKIVFNCNDAEYASALKDSITADTDTVTVTVSDKTVTVELKTAVDSFTTEKLSAKVFLDSLTVIAKKAEPAAPTVTITDISFAPGADALGFKAKVENADMTTVTEIGFEFSVNGVAKEFKVQNGVKEVFSARVMNILKNQGGEMEISGRAYAVINGEKVYGEVKTANMKDTILIVNDMAELSAEQKSAVYGLYNNYATVIAAWIEAAGKVNNIVSWAPEAA